MVFGNKFSNPIMTAIIAEADQLQHFQEAEDTFDVLNEYNGNEAKNEAFAECLKDIERLIKLYIDRIKFVEGKVNQMVALYLGIKADGSNLFKIDGAIRKIGIDGNKELQKIHKEIVTEGNRIWPKFNRLASSFSVKYSADTMDEKEKFAKILEPYSELLDDLYNKYTDDDYQQKILNTYDECIIAARIVGKDDNYTKSLFNVVASWYCFMVDEICYTINDIRYVLKKFGSKDNLIFRILNKDYGQMKNFRFTR